MEEKIIYKLEHLSEIDQFALFVVLLHIGYYFYAGWGHWTIFGGITAQGLDQAGALITTAIDQGELWRLGASVFLHVGLLHLLLNMSNLYFLMLILEPMVGKLRIVTIYVFSGLSASILSWSWGTERTVGASGAIFGLLGFLLVIGFQYKAHLQGRVGRLIRGQLLGWSVFSLLLGWWVPMIDNAAHLGGFVIGLGLGMLSRIRLD